MAVLVSAALLAAVTIPAGICLVLVGHHEHTTRDKITGGDGLVVLAGMFLILILSPLIAFIAS